MTNTLPLLLTTPLAATLAAAVGALLECPVHHVERTAFPNAELLVRFTAGVQGKAVTLLHQVGSDVSSSLMELFLTLDSIRRAGASTIHVVVPYLPYGRQDRRFGLQQALSCRLVGDFLEKAGASSLVTFDLHTPSSEAAFRMPTYSLTAFPLLAEAAMAGVSGPVTFVSPDFGAARKVDRIARRFGGGFAIARKVRHSPTRVDIDMLGDVKNTTAIIMDDTADTGNTLRQVAATLLRQGVTGVRLACTHLVLSGGGEQTLASLPYERLISTDSRVHRALPARTELVTLAPAIATAIGRRAHGLPVPNNLQEDAWYDHPDSEAVERGN